MRYESTLILTLTLTLTLTIIITISTLQIISAGGAGNKLMMVLIGSADLYINSSPSGSVKCYFTIFLEHLVIEFSIKLKFSGCNKPDH